MEVLDLFSAAAGGWSLGMHRAGFKTMAACEFVDWRRALYAENNPGVPLYDDVRTLTAARLLGDLGRLPDVVVGSPPCQDISSANTKGKGVAGERSGLYFEATRIIGECRPRWFALENSANLRTRGADAVIAALEALGYTCWAFVVRASDVGANHERARSWLIGCDLEQVANANGDGRSAQWSRRWRGFDVPHADDPLHATRLRYGSRRARRYGPHGFCSTHAGDASQDRCGSWFQGRHSEPASGACEPACWDAPHADGEGQHAHAGDEEVAQLRGLVGDCQSGDAPDANQAGQADGCVEPGLRQAEIADDGCGHGRSDDGQGVGQVDVCPDDSGDPDRTWADWSLNDLAGRLRMDDGLPARVAGTRVALGTPKGQSAASLIVEAYGDAVVPQIPEAIGRAILRVETALAAVA